MTGLTGQTITTFKSSDIGSIKDSEAAFREREGLATSENNNGSPSNIQNIDMAEYQGLEMEGELKREQKTLKSQISVLRMLMVFIVIVLVALVVGFLTLR